MDRIERIDETPQIILADLEAIFPSILSGDYHGRCARLSRPPLGTTMTPADASNMFQSHYTEILKSLNPVVGYLPSAQWLWYLRRLPTSFFSQGANLNSTAPFDKALAEVLTGNSMKVSTIEVNIATDQSLVLTWV
jgi:hypothetical protein